MNTNLKNDQKSKSAPVDQKKEITKQVNEAPKVKEEASKKTTIDKPGENTETDPTKMPISEKEHEEKEHQHETKIPVGAQNQNEGKENNMQRNSDMKINHNPDGKKNF